MYNTRAARNDVPIPTCSSHANPVAHSWVSRAVLEQSVPLRSFQHAPFVQHRTQQKSPTCPKPWIRNQPLPSNCPPLYLLVRALQPGCRLQSRRTRPVCPFYLGEHPRPRFEVSWKISLLSTAVRFFRCLSVKLIRYGISSDEPTPDSAIQDYIFLVQEAHKILQKRPCLVKLFLGAAHQKTQYFGCFLSLQNPA